MKTIPSTWLLLGAVWWLGGFGCWVGVVVCVCVCVCVCVFMCPQDPCQHVNSRDSTVGFWEIKTEQEAPEAQEYAFFQFLLVVV